MLPFDVLTFDCYGTLIDWEAGITAAFVQTAAADGVSLGREDVLTTYAKVEPAIQAERFVPYREVLTAAACETAHRLGWPIDREKAAFLPESLPAWPAFPDTNEALGRLASRGVMLGILSNVDDDLLTHSRRHFTRDCDFVVTAQQIRSYKPARGHFDAARAVVGDRPWLHVAQSLFHDVEPAHALGIPVAWVNRKHEGPSSAAVPLVEVADLTALVGWLEG